MLSIHALVFDPPIPMRDSTFLRWMLVVVLACGLLASLMYLALRRMARQDRVVAAAHDRAQAALNDLHAASASLVARFQAVNLRFIAAKRLLAPDEAATLTPANHKLLVEITTNVAALMAGRPVVRGNVRVRADDAPARDYNAEKYDQLAEAARQILAGLHPMDRWMDNIEAVCDRVEQAVITVPERLNLLHTRCKALIVLTEILAQQGHYTQAVDYQIRILTTRLEQATNDVRHRRFMAAQLALDLAEPKMANAEYMAAELPARKQRLEELLVAFDQQVVTARAQHAAIDVQLTTLRKKYRASVYTHVSQDFAAGTKALQAIPQWLAELRTLVSAYRLRRAEDQAKQITDALRNIESAAALAESLPALLLQAAADFTAEVGNVAEALVTLREEIDQRQQQRQGDHRHHQSQATKLARELEAVRGQVQDDPLATLNRLRRIARDAAKTSERSAQLAARHQSA